MLKKIALALALAVAGVLLYAASKPDSFTVQRSRVIAASPEKLFPLINDTRAFNTWNPFLRKDPTAPMRYEGPPAGPGAAYAWDSATLGAGRMEVTEAAAPSRVAMRLDFDKPMKASNRVEFTLQPQGAQTLVTWKMSGPMPYLSKLMTTFFDLDKMVGGDFESGLANLKVEAEKG